MLKEFSSWAVSQYQSTKSGTFKIPSKYQERLLKIKEYPRSILHWGGRIDVGPLLGKDHGINISAAFIAIELSARMGVATFLHPISVRQRTSLISLYVVYEGLIREVSSEQMAASWEHALTNAPQFTEYSNKDCALVSNVLHFWAIQCLDHSYPAEGWQMTNILTGARLQLGQVWYWGTIRYTKVPGSLVWLTAIQSVEEILERHIKAASKRLRWQQVKRIQVEAPHSLRGSAEDLRYWIAAYVLTHSWNSEMLSTDWQRKNAPALRSLMSVIEFEWSVHKTEEMWTQSLQELSTLFVGITPSQIAEVSELPIDRWSVRQAEHRGLKSMIQRCQNSTNQTTQPQLDSFELCIPVEIRLLTSRGGTWPERRNRVLWSTF